MPPSEVARLSGVLRSRGLTLACAESCTGGMIGAALTAEPGASSFFLGSAVTYSDASKERILGVPRGVLEEHGAVSAETAREMVRGAVEAYGSDTGVAVTGVAGPGGGTERKPVGLVYIAASDGPRTVVAENRFGGGRGDVRSAAVAAAAGLLADLLEGRL